MKATEIAKEMAVARGFFHYILLALLFEGYTLPQNLRSKAGRT